MHSQISILGCFYQSISVMKSCSLFRIQLTTKDVGFRRKQFLNESHWTQVAQAKFSLFAKRRYDRFCNQKIPIILRTATTAITGITNIISRAFDWKKPELASDS